MMMAHAGRAGTRPDPHHPLPPRVGTWHRDATVGAFTIARWEDDGGLVGPVNIRPDRPPSSDGRTIPHGNRTI